MARLSTVFDYPRSQYEFGAGPLGIGLSDAPAGGVFVSEVADGSAASVKGVQVGRRTHRRQRPPLTPPRRHH